MMCQAKTSYIETEIEWGARFEPCMTLEKGAFRVDYRRFHETYQVPLPRCSACQSAELQGQLDWGLQAEEEEEEGDRDDQADGGGLGRRLFWEAPGFGIDQIQEERASEVNECEFSV